VLPALARPAGRTGAGDAQRRVLPRAAGRGRRPRRHPGPPPRPRAATGGHGMNLSSPLPLQATDAAPDWARVRVDFPLLMREVHGKPLVYFDNANTAQKPLPVIEATSAFYRRHNANVSRAVHALGTEATDAYEGARGKLARFLNVRADE